MTQAHGGLPISRWLLAGPVAGILAALVMLDGVLVIPPGNARVDHVLFPIIFFPAIWAMLSFCVIAARSSIRTLWVMLSLMVATALPIVGQHLGMWGKL
jgi:hypothetical protein